MPTEKGAFVVTSRLPFTIEETELYELINLAGITIDPRVFKYVKQTAALF